MNHRKNEIEEVTSGTLNRIDGLISRPLLVRFLNTFEELYQNMVDSGDEFEITDVIEYLTKQMSDYAADIHLYEEKSEPMEEEKDEMMEAVKLNFSRFFKQ